MSYYAESPLERIVDVHWKKKREPPDPGDLSPPYCGRYGWGSIMALATPSVITGTPYGPNTFVPNVGTFSTTRFDPVYGGMAPSGFAMLEFSETLTAGIGIIAQFIRLTGGDMIFTNNQLVFIRDLNGLPGRFEWSVPMASGQTADGIPMVIKNYTITMAWHSTHVDPGDLVGLGISHPLPDQNTGTPSPTPTEPAVVLGSRADGGAAYTYDFKYEQWAGGFSRVNEGNQFDPNLGGPAILWWMTKRVGQAWGASQQFMGTVLVGTGDNYTWEIIGSCQPMPNYSPPV